MKHFLEPSWSIVEDPWTVSGGDAHWRVFRNKLFHICILERWISEKKGIYHTLPSHEMIQIQTGSEAYLAPVVISFEMDGL
jgi:hypothetical protein